MRKKYTFKRVLRYAIYMTQYIGERLRGLDFSMPTAGEITRNTVENYGYCKTSERHIKRILKMLPVDAGDGCYLDVGCGKGLTIKAAKDLNYKKVGGIDLDERLINIAKQNMKKLKIEDVSFHLVNAMEFEGYGEYNVFFFFNPFDNTVLTPVIQKILDSVKENRRKIYVIYHHPKYREVMENAGLKEIVSIYEWLRDCYTSVYTLD